MMFSQNYQKKKKRVIETQVEDILDWLNEKPNSSKAEVNKKRDDLNKKNRSYFGKSTSKT